MIDTESPPECQRWFVVGWEAERASVTDGTVALESLSEFLAMKLMAGSLPQTHLFLTFPENHQECELGTWGGCTDGAE